MMLMANVSRVANINPMNTPGIPNFGFVRMAASARIPNKPNNDSWIYIRL